jgi:hypothetical protein
VGGRGGRGGGRGRGREGGTGAVESTVDKRNCGDVPNINTTRGDLKKLPFP